MQLMTIGQQQDQQQRQQGYFTMPEAPTLEEQLDAVDSAFYELSVEGGEVYDYSHRTE